MRYILLLVVLPLQLQAKTLFERYDSAVDYCLAPNQKSLDIYYTEAPADMVGHYKPSMTQRALFYPFNGLFDRFGGAVQGMLASDEVAHVKPFLEFLGKELRKKAKKEGLSQHQSICIASCITNQLMEPDMKVPSNASMELAVARGKGKCRHFLLAMDTILGEAKIPSKYGYSFDHIFFYFQHNGKKVIFDPGMNDGSQTCEFYKEVK